MNYKIIFIQCGGGSYREKKKVMQQELLFFIMGDGYGLASLPLGNQNLQTYEAGSKSNNSSP